MESLIAKMPKNKVIIPKGTIFEAMLEREAKGKAEVILALMEQLPDWTDEKIAQIAKLELSFVLEVRKQLNGDKK